MSCREATHAGTWYSSNKEKLSDQLDDWIGSDINGKARVIIGPHAGFTYSGEILGKCYKQLDLHNIKRIFILGPSHYVYFKDKVLLSKFNELKTPIGKIQVDNTLNKQLVEKDGDFFKYMTYKIDNTEHSIELHLPFLNKMMQREKCDAEVVPILISSLNNDSFQTLKEYLQPFYNDQSNAFVISSDFCHWGSRFDYTVYSPSLDLKDLIMLDDDRDVSIPIHKSIEYLDRQGMEIISTGNYAKFRKYIKTTGNTICGEKPISIMLLLMNTSNAIKWCGYKQSSRVLDSGDSSVSYAAGYAVV